MATLSAPFVVQIVLGLLLVTMWALGKGPFMTERGHTERSWMLIAVVITTVVSLALAAVLGKSPSPRNRGIALSIAGSSATVLIGGIIFAYLVLR
ncbi:hypothetical protein [Mycobacterium mantenii]|uniref:hypothetical protein n=1 Tax=Mycobacterium mantenii TaxID=560555 RepID=UPI001E5710BA|nr:hypothetical protein [Mycobacterium mantenii]